MADATKYQIHGFQLANSGIFDVNEDIAPSQTERTGKHIEVIVQLGKDHTGTLIFDEEAIAANPDIFVPVYNNTTSESVEE